MKNALQVTEKLSQRNRLLLLSAALFAIAAVVGLLFISIRFKNYCVGEAHYYRNASHYLSIGGTRIYIESPTTIHSGNTSFYFDPRPSLLDSFLMWLHLVGAVCIWPFFAFIALFMYSWVQCICARLCDKLGLETALVADHGKSLLAVAIGIRYAPVEYVARFTDNGTKIGEGTLLCSSKTRLCRADSELARRMNGIVSIHNHPFSEASFSSQDFAASIYYRESRSIVVASSFVYTLELSPECWKLNSDEVKSYCEKLFAQEKGSGRERTVRISQQMADKFGFVFRQERYIAFVWHEFVEMFKSHRDAMV